jgi:hypothetical protein
MPEAYQPSRPYPGKRYRLQDAADANQLIAVRCLRCRRSAHYLASDLIHILNPRADAHQRPFACSKCWTAADMKVKLISPSPGDYGHLVVRRPGPVRHIQTWKSVRLGD